MLRLDRIQMREHDWRIASVLPLQLQQLLVSSSKRRAAGMATSRGARGGLGSAPAPGLDRPSAPSGIVTFDNMLYKLIKQSR